MDVYEHNDAKEGKGKACGLDKEVGSYCALVNRGFGKIRPVVVNELDSTIQWGHLSMIR